LKFIDLGLIDSRHGFPRDGFCFFKIRLYAIGGALFQHRKDFFVKNGNAYSAVTFTEPTKAHGGSFGKAKGILVQLPDRDDWIGKTVALPRELLPATENEIYLCDLIGAEVMDEHGVGHGKIISCYEEKGSFSVDVKMANGKKYSFPLQWAEKTSLIPNEKITVSEVSEWIF